jgi:protein TonB
MPHRDVPRVTHSRPQPVPVATPTPVSTPVVHAPASTPTSTPAITPVRTAPTVTRTPLQHAQLGYRDAPAPTYPMQARHMHMQGTVVLRVLVDVHGNPSRVQVQNSSGWPLLDRVARLQVLRHWTFQPARVDGRTVRAWARVPVVFSLQRP